MAMWFDEGENTKSRLMRELIAEIKRVGRPVTWQEFKDGGREPNNYAYYWGCFAEAVKEALFEMNLDGRKPQRPQSEMEKLIATGKVRLVVHAPQKGSFKQSKARVETVEFAKAAERRPRKKRKRQYEREDLLVQLKQIQEYYHISGEPTQQQITAHAKLFGTACYQVFRKRLGAKGTWMEKTGR